MKRFPFPSKHKSMRGRELKRVFESSSFFEGLWRRNYMELHFSFWGVDRGFERKTQESFLALSLREKREKWGENSDLGGSVGN